MRKDIEDKMIDIAEDLGWTVSIDEESYCFNQYSPKGMDFSFFVEGKTFGEVVKDMEDYYEDFDVSYEAYLWLDDFGHGRNGAPYEMIDIYNDMKACKDMVENLIDALNSEEMDIDEWEDDENESV